MKQDIDDLLAGQCKKVNELLNTPTEAWNGGISCVGNYHVENGPTFKFVQAMENGGYRVICDAASPKSLSKMIYAFISGVETARDVVFSKIKV